MRSAAAALLLLLSAFASAASPGDRIDGLRRRLYTDGRHYDAIRKASVEVLRGMPHETRLDAVRNVLRFMQDHIRYASDRPIPRGPHEMSARWSLAHGSVNGCVESAKVFFLLFRSAYPRCEARYLDSFNADCPSGGHAVVEVLGDDGVPFLVDAASFPKLSGAGRAAPPVREEDLETPVFDSTPDKKGMVVQLPEDSDLYIHKEDGGYLVTRYEYRRLFGGKLLGEKSFRSLEEVRGYLAGLFGGPEGGPPGLRKSGLLLDYADPDRTYFLYHNWCGEKPARHVVYSCYRSLPKKDRAGEIEPAAREEFKKTGRVTTCRP